MRLTMEECAWLARAWAGKFPARVTQKEIASEVGISSALVYSALRKFFDENHKLVDEPFGLNHREDVRKVVLAYEKAGGKFNRPQASVPMRPMSRPEMEARREHAWLLRAEGMTLKEIGKRLGVSNERARHIILDFSKRVRRAMLRTRFKVS